MRQLRCLGVMETVHIRRLGFPIRVKFDSFLERFVSPKCSDSLICK